MLNKKNILMILLMQIKYLIANNIGHPKKLFAMGEVPVVSLMGAVINFEPKLYQELFQQFLLLMFSQSAVR